MIQKMKDIPGFILVDVGGRKPYRILYADLLQIGKVQQVARTDGTATWRATACGTRFQASRLKPMWFAEAKITRLSVEQVQLLVPEVLGLDFSYDPAEHSEIQVTALV